MTVFLLLSCGVSFMVSLWLWSRGRAVPALLTLMAAAFLLRMFMAGLDPFLHDWDERFHALVAKNMISHPLKPMLRVAELLPADYRAWCCNHVWLHKQPLFLWQIALSMKLFGVNELALRLPSALLSSLMLWPVYRIGCLAFNCRTGYLAAVLLTFAYYQLEQVSGALGMDHNDVAFNAYVTGSIWAYYEYRASSRPFRWALAAGVLAGAAVLCKWLTGLVVFSVWGLDVVLNPAWRRQVGEYSRMLLAFTVAVLIFLPWQLYTARRFPLESTYEREYNTRHFTEALEGHDFPWYYHFEQARNHYGWLTILILIGLGLALWRYRQQRISPLLGVIVIIYAFFSVAATKVWSYAYVVSSLMLLLAALSLSVAWDWLQSRKWPLAYTRLIAASGLLVVLFLSLRPAGIVAYHFKEQIYGPHTVPLNRETHLANATLYRQIAEQVPAGYAVFNALPNEEVQAMFYSGRPVYSWWPPQEQWEKLRQQVRGLAVFPGHHNQYPPEYVRKTPGLIEIWGMPR